MSWRQGFGRSEANFGSERHGIHPAWKHQDVEEVA